jgi:hypothetical protein
MDAFNKWNGQRGGGGGGGLSSGPRRQECNFNGHPDHRMHSPRICIADGVAPQHRNDDERLIFRRTLTIIIVMLMMKNEEILEI